MKAVLFSPHNDDETLFAFYSMLRYKTEVVVILRSMRQQKHQNGPTYETREAETFCATTVAGASYVQWTAFYDTDPDWSAIATFMQDYIDLSKPGIVLAPAYEIDGHEDHNAVAEIVDRLDGDFIDQRYLTYRRGHGRSEGHPVVATEAEKMLKRQALACYASQREHPPTAPWFGDDQREFIL